MPSGVNVTTSEWGDWAEYFAETFPGASKEFIEQMTRRMIRTLSYCGLPKRMAKLDLHRRCVNMLEALNAMPDDSIKGGGYG